MSVKERLKKYIKYKHLSQRMFEGSVGLSNGYINNIKNSIQPDKIQRIILRYPDLNTGWLLTGEGEMLKISSPVEEPQAIPQKSNVISMPEEVWDVIKKQANSLEAKDKQVSELIAIIQENLKKELPAAEQKRAVK